MRARPKTIGKYEVVDERARDSMGVVYSAHDPPSNGTVALKVTHQDKLEEKGAQHFRKLVFNEA